MNGANETPLHELLANVPRECRLEVEISPFHARMIPVGELCHRAAIKLAASRVEVERLAEASRAFVQALAPWLGHASIPMSDLDAADRLARKALARKEESHV